MQECYTDPIEEIERKDKVIYYLFYVSILFA